MAISAKAMLQEIRLRDVNIKNKMEELENLKQIATSITSSFGTEPVSGTRNGDKIGSLIARIVDLERDINQMIDDYVDYRREIQSAMEQINDPLKVSILYKHYFLYESYGEIAANLGYSYRWVCSVHGRALQSLDRIMKKKGKKDGKTELN